MVDQVWHTFPASPSFARVWRQAVLISLSIRLIAYQASVTVRAHLTSLPSVLLLLSGWTLHRQKWIRWRTHRWQSKRMSGRFKIAARCECPGMSLRSEWEIIGMYQFIDNVPSSMSSARLSTNPIFTWTHRSHIPRCSMMTPSVLLVPDSHSPFWKRVTVPYETPKLDAWRMFY